MSSEEVKTKTTPTLPVITAAVTVPVAHLGNGTAGVFTISISTAQTTKTVVKYLLKGTAVNGKDYVMLSGKTKVKPGKTSANVQVVPEGSLGSATSKSVKLEIEPAARSRSATLLPPRSRSSLEAWHPLRRFRPHPDEARGWSAKRRMDGAGSGRRNARSLLQGA